MVIDVYSDVVCPWCYIGERRLERAMALRLDVQAIDAVAHMRPITESTRTLAVG